MWSKMSIFSFPQNPKTLKPSHHFTSGSLSKQEEEEEGRSQEKTLGDMTGRASKLFFSKKLCKPLLPESMNDLPPRILGLLHHHFSTTPRNNNRPMMGGETGNDEDGFLQKFESSYDDDDHEGFVVNDKKQLPPPPPPNPIPNRPLRGEKRMSSFKLGNNDERMKPPPRAQFERRSEDRPSRKLPFSNTSNNLDPPPPPPPTVQFPNINKPTGEKVDDQSVATYLEKFHLGDEKKESGGGGGGVSTLLQETPAESQPEDADEIFKNMKETGLIPNAVSMLDALCKDGLLQEAMKLFGLMRERGTIPEVVIYTAVVEGFCRAQKLEDAKRIFRKMENNGISPNAFSYTVLIQGLCKAKRLEDAIDFCVEMLEAGHSPNMLTFVSLVDGVCTKDGVEEAENVILRLKDKGFFVNEKAVREHLDKKGSFSPLVWEAIFGKKTSQRPF